MNARKQVVGGNVVGTDGMSAKKRHVMIAMATAVALSVSGPAFAEWKPTKTIEVIIPSKPGGGQDLTGRSVAAVIAALTGASTIAVNKTGAGGGVSLKYLNAHKRDGHYLAISSGRLLTSYIEGVTRIGYKDVTPLAQVLTEYAFFSVKSDSKLKSGKDMIAVLKKNPKSLSIYNGNGLGSPTHIAIASMARSAGIDPTALKLVSYGSGGVAMASLLGGHIDVHVATGASVVPRFEEGVIRILGVSAPKRLGGSIAGVPTWKEQGFEFEAERSTTIFGPKGLSKDQIAYWDGILAKMVKTEQWKKSAAKGFRENTYFNSTATVKYLDKAHKDLTEIMTKLDLIQK